MSSYEPGFGKEKNNVTKKTEIKVDKQNENLERIKLCMAVKDTRKDRNKIIITTTRTNSSSA